MKNKVFHPIHFAIVLTATVICVTTALLATKTSDAWSHVNNLKNDIQLSSDGSFSAFISERSEGTKVLIQSSDGSRYWDFSPTSNATLNKIAMSTDGKYLAAVGSGVYMLSLKDKKLLWSYTSDGKDTVAISSDGTWVAAGGSSAKVYLFKKDSSQVVKQWSLGDKEDPPNAVAISDSGKTIAVAGNLGVYLIDTSKNTIKWQVKPTEKATKIKLSSDGKYLLGTSMKNVYFWNTKSSKVVWQKKFSTPLISADMSTSGDKIVTVSSKGISVLNNKGTELRHFDGDFGNGDAAVSQNGQFIYINGGKRLYSFDDSYSQSELRPFHIATDMSAGQHSKLVKTSMSGNLVTYPTKSDIQFYQSTPAILAVQPTVPVLIKDGSFDFDFFVTNPTIKSTSLTLEVRLSLPSSATFWTSLAKKTSSKDSPEVKSKILSYLMNDYSGSKLVRTEYLTLQAGSSIDSGFTETVPDLADGVSFNDQLGNALSSLSPASLLNSVLSALIKTPLSKLIGDDMANTVIASASRAITASVGEMIYPTPGLGTATIYDENGTALDQDIFYFVYLR